MTKPYTLLIALLSMACLDVNAQVTNASSDICTTIGSATSPVSKNEPIFDTATIPIFFHLIQSENGTGHVPTTAINDQIQALNTSFDGIFEFHLLGWRRVLNSDWFEADPTDPNGKHREFSPALGLDQKRVLNVYVLDLQPASLAGVSVFPSSAHSGTDIDGVYLDYRVLPGMGGLYSFASDEGDWLAHEIGHYFGLLHTFQGVDNNMCPRVPLDPVTQGDLVPDTDPHRRPSLEQIADCSFREGCEGRGSIEPVNNFMNYSSDECRRSFTPGQRSRMRRQTSAYRRQLMETPLSVGIDRDIRIHAGEELLFNGATIQFSEGTRLINFGNLVVNNSTLTSDSHWKGIYFGSNSSGFIDNTAIQNVGGGGGVAAIKVYRSSPTITNSVVSVLSSGKQYGLYVTGNSTVNLRTSEIESASGPAIKSYGGGATTFVYSSTLRQLNDGPAVSAGGGSLVMFWPGATAPFVGYNKIHGSLVEATNDGFLNAGSGSWTTSRNQFCEPITLKVRGGGVIWARYNYWQSNPQKRNEGGTIRDSPGLGPPMSCRPGSRIASSTTSQPADDFVPGLMDAVLHNGPDTEKQLSALFDHADENVRRLAAVLATRFLHKRSSRRLIERLEKSRRRDAYRRLVERGLSSYYDHIGTHAVSRSIINHYSGNSDDTNDVRDWLLLHKIDARSREKNGRAAGQSVSLLDVQSLERSSLGSNPSEARQSVANGLPAEVSVDRRLLTPTATVYPNPFNPTTTISFQSKQEFVRIEVFDVTGKRITTLANRAMKSGRHRVKFDGREYESGIYMYRITKPSGVLTGSFVLLK